MRSSKRVRLLATGSRRFTGKNALQAFLVFIYEDRKKAQGVVSAAECCDACDASAGPADDAICYQWSWNHQTEVHLMQCLPCAQASFYVFQDAASECLYL